MLNKVMLIGNLGADPDVRYMPSGSAVTNFRMATSEKFKNKDTGEREERTEWHNIATFGRLAEVCGEYLAKGSKVYVEGKLRTRKWQDREKRDRYSTEVIADRMQMLDSKGSGRGSGKIPDSSRTPDAKQDTSRRAAEPETAKNGPQEDFEDDIPF